MLCESVISLTRELLSVNTVNPPGNEIQAARVVGQLLSESEFSVSYIPFGPDRMHVVAERGCGGDIPPVVFTGHFDTVPLGSGQWTVDPFMGVIAEGRLYGRGSSDMKGGIAAMVVAAIHAFKNGTPAGGVRLVLTAGEESGCFGAKHLVENFQNLGRARGIIVGEPSSNIPAIGHKGGLYLNLTTSGITAHSSMPHLGVNAIYKAAHAISKVEKFDYGIEPDPLLGLPTINVGQVFGGLNLNSVPDYAGFTIDARTTKKVDHKWLLEQLKTMLGDEVSIEILVDLPPVSTPEDDPFVSMVYSACGISQGTAGFPKALPYLTDGSVLQPAYRGAPTVILGPGEPEMAHKTDEFCLTSRLEEAVSIYKSIILKGGIKNE